MASIKKYLRSFIGDKAFYRTVMALAVPVMLQNGLTNLVSLLDNIMVGSVGTDQMSGVSIVNQLLFVFNLCVFGALSGAGIFTAQFFGKGDHEGVRQTFRFKLITSAVILAVGLLVFTLFSEPLIASYLHEGSETGDIVATAGYAADYVRVMLWGLFPFALMQTYASTLRETGETLLPMKAGIVAIFINLILNYVLIFGHFGAPAMGVEGAALATVISRYVECAIVVIWTHRHSIEVPFIIGAYRTLKVPSELVKRIITKGMPLLANEFLWSAGMAMLTQRYAMRGLAVVAGLNICSTVSNLFSVVWMSMGTAVSIMVGQLLGASEFVKARQTAKKLLAFSVASAAAIGVIIALLSPLFPQLYNTSEETRQIATGLLLIVASALPLHSFIHASYFTLRSGGKTWITFLFDSMYVWVVALPLATWLTNATSLHIFVIYALVQYVDIIKCVIGTVMLKKGVWINNIIDAR